MALLSEADRARIAEAIAAAEAQTAAEIVVVVAARSAEYRFVPWLWASLAALIVPAPLIFLTILAGFEIYFIQLAVFLALFLALLHKGLRMALTPGWAKREAVRDRAREQFLARGIGVTAGRTGALIFASNAERMVEILVDDGLAKGLEAGVLEDAIGAIAGGIRAERAADGFVTAISRLGAAFARLAPPRPGDRNELPDDVVTL